MKIEVETYQEELSIQDRIWRHRLTVRTLVFETSNAGSNPADA